METDRRRTRRRHPRQAEAELRERLVKVERKGCRQAAPTHFRTYARTGSPLARVVPRWKPIPSRVPLCPPASRRRVRADADRRDPAAPRRRVRARNPASSARRRSAVTSPSSTRSSTARCGEELIESNPATRAERPRLPTTRWRLQRHSKTGRLSGVLSPTRGRGPVFRTLTLTGAAAWRAREASLGRREPRSRRRSASSCRSRKRENGEPIGRALADALAKCSQSSTGARSAFQGDEELVFCHPERGTDLPR